MVNLIGAAPDARTVLAMPGAHLHLYGKEPRPGRKLGHVTLVDQLRTRRRSTTHGSAGWSSATTAPVM